MTKIEMFNTLLNLVAASNLSDKAEIADKLNNEIALLQKKASTPRKPTATQTENEGFKTEIMELLSASESMYTIKEIQSAIPTLVDLSCQRMTHLLTALRKDGKVKRTYIKKDAYFSAGVEETVPAE